MSEAGAKLGVAGFDFFDIDFQALVEERECTFDGMPLKVFKSPSVGVSILHDFR